MKLILTLLATFTLGIPAASAAQLAQPDQAIAPDARLASQLGDQGAILDLGDLVYEEDAIREAEVQVAARVVRRRAVVVGPGGRTFIYRGRPLAVIQRPAYVYPPGYAYRRWAVGALLPAALIATPFFFLEWQALGLRPPPPGYHWVRYGPDLVLVNDRTRRIDYI